MFQMRTKWPFSSILILEEALKLSMGRSITVSKTSLFLLQTAAFTALSTARTLAVAMSSSMPQPQIVLPLPSTHSR